MKEIGAYFELELPRYPLTEPMHSEGVRLNSARHALEYILSLKSNIDNVWLPEYTCEVVYEPLRRLGLNIRRYHIDRNLEIQDLPCLGPDDMIVVNNYYGLKDEYVSQIASIYGDKIIIDNAQAWYADVADGVKAIYSPRKFFGLPDGGIAVNVPDHTVQLEVDQSYDRFAHLLKRIDLSASAGYKDFSINSAKLSDIGLMKMSPLTERLLNIIDFSSAKRIRQSNFEYLAKTLGDINELGIPQRNEYACPMVYPLLTDKGAELKQQLIKNKIYVPTYWPNVLEECDAASDEYYLANNLLALPIDQRYAIDDMEHIVRIIRENI